MKDGGPSLSGPVLQLAAHQFEPGIVHISDLTFRVGSPDDLRRLLCQYAKQGLLARQRQRALSHHFLQPGVVLVDFLHAAGIFYRDAGQLCQLRCNIFILLTELVRVFARQLEQPDMPAIAPCQGHRQPTAQHAVPAGRAAHPSPARMRLHLGLGHAHRPLAMGTAQENAGAFGQCKLLAERGIVV